jgi:hypothetical protein
MRQPRELAVEDQPLGAARYRRESRLDDDFALAQPAERDLTKLDAAGLFKDDRMGSSGIPVFRDAPFSGKSAALRAESDASRSRIYRLVQPDEIPELVDDRPLGRSHTHPDGIPSEAMGNSRRLTLRALGETLITQKEAADEAYGTESDSKHLAPTFPAARGVSGKPTHSFKQNRLRSVKGV